MTLPASGSLSVDGGKNGGIRVKGRNVRTFSSVPAFRPGERTEEAARAVASGSGSRPAERSKPNHRGDENWGVSYEILVPAIDRSQSESPQRRHLDHVRSKVVCEFETLRTAASSLIDVAGDVRGRTTNGGVNVALAGNSWKGSGLDVTTTNGGVHLTMPETYAANIETGTTNGGFRSDIPALNVTQEDVKGADRHQRATRLNTALNGGGAPIRVITTNGGVNISSASKASILRLLSDWLRRSRMLVRIGQTKLRAP